MRCRRRENRRAGRKQAFRYNVKEVIAYALKQKIAAPVMSAAMSDLLYKLEFASSLLY